MRISRGWYPRLALIVAAGGNISSALFAECPGGRAGLHEGRLPRGVCVGVGSLEAVGVGTTRGEHEKIRARSCFLSEFLVYNTLMGKRWVSARGAWTRLLNTPLPSFFPMGFGQKPNLYS